MKKIFSYSFLPSLMLLPVVAKAQFGGIDTFFTDAAGFINNTLIPILLAIAFLVFIIGAVRFFLLAGDGNEEGKKKGRSLMLAGIIGFVVIVSIWGIVALIANGLGLNDDTLNNIPNTPL